MNVFDSTDSGQPVSTAILEAVAEKTTADPNTLPPLYERVEIDAIEELFQPTPEGNGRTGSIEFPYYGYDVTVEYLVGTKGTVEIESTDRL